MLGVLHDAVVFLLEQLYGARHCSRYRFRFHKPEESDKLPLNPHGAARAEQHHRWAHTCPLVDIRGCTPQLAINPLSTCCSFSTPPPRRSVFDMFNFLASKHRQPPEYNPFDEEEEESLLKSAR